MKKWKGNKKRIVVGRLSVVVFVKGEVITKGKPQHIFSLLGAFVCTFIPKRSGTYLAMVRFNGQNVQNKWAKVVVASEQVRVVGRV
jgi:F0F1-type ATP synthase assembly protein I